MATMRVSNRGRLRRITDSWPLVMGSNEPGKTAMRFMVRLFEQM